ncbi:MAG: D-2-hydroxyacid dehydrogenase family protein [Pseudomonadota bacterium]
MIIAIPDDYHGLVHKLDCFHRLAAHDVRILRDAAPPTGKLIGNLRDAEVIVPIRERTRFTRDIIAQLPRLRLFSQTGRSAHHIDIAACTERGIAVAAGTQASPHTVAEHTWTLILAALRRIPQETALMQRGGWRESFSFGLHGRTLGICGFGKIGSLIAATGRSFGMRVLVYGRESTLTRAKAAGYAVAGSRQEFFGQADVLSLMLRLTAETRGSVTAADLSRMKPTALLVNTARAELIAPGALVDALKKGRPGFAATDVYENEPVLGGSHPLLQLDNALCTPHSAWVEKDTYELYFGEAFDNILAYLRGDTLNLLNPEVLGGQRRPALDKS